MRLGDGHTAPGMEGELCGELEGSTRGQRGPTHVLYWVFQERVPTEPQQKVPHHCVYGCNK
jgi:hypothetical protein